MYFFISKKLWIFVLSYPMDIRICMYCTVYTCTVYICQSWKTKIIKWCFLPVPVHRNFFWLDFTSRWVGFGFISASNWCAIRKTYKLFTQDPESNRNSGVEAVVRAIIVLSLLPNMAVIQARQRGKHNTTGDNATNLICLSRDFVLSDYYFTDRVKRFRASL